MATRRRKLRFWKELERCPKCGSADKVHILGSTRYQCNACYHTWDFRRVFTLKEGRPHG